MKPHNVKKRRLILASASPRRQELLKLCGRPFIIRIAEADEEVIVNKVKTSSAGLPFCVLAEKIVMELAAAKAESVFPLYADAVIVGADTIVTLDNCIIGKPESQKQAYEMLRNLCGRRHQVLTGVSIKSETCNDTFFTKTAIEFYPYDNKTEDLIRRYIDTGSPMDKAGAYGIQDMGALFVKKIEGDFYTVMGLPVAELCRRLDLYM